MKRSERLYANGFIQLISVFFLVLFFIMTYAAKPDNLLWFVAALLLGLYGFIRKVRETLIVCLVFLLVYGATTLFRIYFGAGFALGWNELIWLFVFPFIALVGGLNRPDESPPPTFAVDFSALYPPPPEDSEQADTPADESYGFVDADGFREQFARELTDARRAHRRSTLMLIGLTEFEAFKQEYELADIRIFVQYVARLIHEVAQDAKIKAYIEEGLFAIVLTGEEHIAPGMVKALVNERYHAMLLSRSRREGLVRVKLAFGLAESPADGWDAPALLEKAKQHLKGTEL